VKNLRYIERLGRGLPFVLYETEKSGREDRLEGCKVFLVELPAGEQLLALGIRFIAKVAYINNMFDGTIFYCLKK